MKVLDVVCSASKTGFFFDDQRAIKIKAVQDGFCYVGQPVTPGFSRIRHAGEAVSFTLVLEDGQLAWGDCVAVQYSGSAGRDPLFLAEKSLPLMEKEIAPRLRGREIKDFRGLAEEMDKITINGKRLHTAIRYGVTQAILDAVAKTRKLTMAEVIQDEYRITSGLKRVPILAQSGDDRYINADKMIIKGADVLPHGLFNNMEKRLGHKGEILKEYVAWLRERILRLRTQKSYNPVIHLDVYGTIGQAFNNETEEIAVYLGELRKLASPFKLLIEGPVEMENKAEQIRALKDLRETLKEKRIAVGIVADEWCNSLEDIKLFADKKAVDMIHIKTPDLGGVNNVVEAILYCKRKGVAAYCGGTCNGTDKSARVSTNIAMACGADLCMAKPGMGVDEGYMIVYNEMNRVLALNKARERINSLLAVSFL